MPQKKKKTTDPSNLRQRAEEALKVSSIDNDYPAKFSSDEIKTLIHDLNIHQIELEMQNDELQRSQAELEIERDRYFDFYNMAPVGFFSINEQKLIVECNLTAAKMLEKNKTDIINQPITRFIIKEDQDVYYLHNKQLLETQIPHGCDLRMLKSDGSVLWVYLETTLVLNAEGTTVSRLVISDISQRKQAEIDLQESEKKFKSIFDDANDGILLADVTTKRFVMANNVICKMLGYSKEEILNLSVYDIHPEKEHPLVIEGFERQSRREIRLVENFPVKRKDGTIFYADINSSPISIGAASFLVGIFRDITKRKKVEDLLKLNDQRYKESQRIGHVGNWEYDIMKKSFWGSDETKRIYGFNPESKKITEEEVEKCIPDRERVHQALIDLIENGQPYDIEFEIQPLTETNKKIVQSIAEIIKNESGIPTKVAGVIHDITAIKLANEQERKSEKKYRNLFNSINDYILVADINRNIIDCNQALKSGFGYRLEEILGKKTIYLYSSEEEYQKMGKELKKHLDDTRFAYTIDYKKKSGETFPGETTVFYLKNDLGEIVGFIGIIRDITHLRMIEESLQKSNDKLKEKAAVVEDMNAALRVLLQKREKDNQEIEENILSNYELMINPFLHKLKSSTPNQKQQNLLSIMETNLKEIIAPFSKKLSDPLKNLTPSEIQIAAMVKQGLSNKEIAHILNNSVRTITKHRDHIRDKLNLKNKKINLRSYLSNL